MACELYSKLETPFSVYDKGFCNILQMVQSLSGIEEIYFDPKCSGISYYLLISDLKGCLLLLAWQWLLLRFLVTYITMISCSSKQWLKVTLLKWIQTITSQRYTLARLNGIGNRQAPVNLR